MEGLGEVKVTGLVTLWVVEVARKLRVFIVEAATDAASMAVEDEEVKLSDGGLSGVRELQGQGATRR